MRKVVLAPGVESSVLGFGCAPILGSVGAREARRAVDCALDLGVNHFDVARCYGYGDAERFVGRLLKGRRGHVVIASKFGIEATPLARALGPVKPLVRLLRGKSRSKAAQPNNSGKKSGSSGPFLRAVPATAARMERSLEQSLRGLGTDYLDLFLLHEPDWSSLPTDEIARSVEKLKQQGKIRAFGAAFYRDGKIPAVAGLGMFDFLQFDCPRVAMEYNLLREERASVANVIFSPSQSGSAGQDLPDVLARLWADFPRSVVLSSMFNEDHIRANVAKAGS